eukprot:GHVL01038898.1.p1 GENE.GHVL01038898.1~~GHVL01038898.1.p1  ORF type:complete len:572 (+),score=109.21 GHVL01038898.1:550-2265(+)
MDVIQKQNGEIRTLTDSKVEAEERIERMRQVQRIEIEKYKNEALIRIESTKDAAQDQIKKAQTAMVEQLRELNESYEATKRENHNYLAKINEERQRHAQEMELKQLESETIRESLESKIEKIARELSNMHGCLEENKRTIFDLNNQLRIQKNKYFELVDDRSNSDKKLSQDIAHFKERATCLEHSLESERVGWFEERRTLEKHYEDVLQSRNSIEAASKSCQHSLACCRTELLTMESDMKTQNGVIGELRRQIRDGDEVLSGVMKANDHLRNELEDQRKRIIDANERELNDIRTKYEEEAARTKTIQKKFVETLEAQIQSVYHDAANKETELECTRQQAESIDRERRSLHNDLSIWKSQCESISQMREVAEEKIAHLSRELSLLKSSHLEEKVCEASSLEVAQDRINELQRALDSKNRKTMNEISNFHKTVIDQESKLKESDPLLTTSCSEVGNNENKAHLKHLKWEKFRDESQIHEPSAKSECRRIQQHNDQNDIDHEIGGYHQNARNHLLESEMTPKMHVVNEKVTIQEELRSSQKRNEELLLLIREKKTCEADNSFNAATKELEKIQR